MAGVGPKNQEPMGDPTGAVRHELQAVYTRAGEAYKAKDADAVMQFVAPGFAQAMPDGRTLAYEEAGQLLRKWFATTDAVTLYEVRIGTLKPVGTAGGTRHAEIRSLTGEPPRPPLPPGAEPPGYT